MVDLPALRAKTARLIATIDRQLQEQLDAILHHPRFQRLEALWRGTFWLIDGNDDPQVKVRLLIPPSGSP